MTIKSGKQCNSAENMMHDVSDLKRWMIDV